MHKHLKNTIIGIEKKPLPIIVFVGSVCLCIALITVGFPAIKKYNAQRSLTSLVVDAKVTNHIFIELAVERQALIYMYISSVLSERGDQEILLEAIHENIVLQSRFIETIYTTDAQKEFQKLLTDETTALKQYAQAYANKDTEQQTHAFQQMLQAPSRMATLFASLEPGISADLLTVLYKEHIASIKTMIDAYQAKDYRTAYAHKKLATDQTRKIAIAVLYYMQESHPDSFN